MYSQGKRDSGDTMQKNNAIRDKLIFPAAAILPVLFMLTAYARSGFWPFGDKTVYTWDLQAQYSSFMVLLHNLLTGKEHIGYSLTGGLGGSLYGLAAYYLGSPFNIIMIFFDERTMPAGILLLILLKTAGMGLFMFLYLYQKKRSPLAILFSTAYAFSAYAIVYQSNIMWLDALVFLPLVIWGLEKLIKEGKCLLCIISLGLTIISNYFTAYMVCLFVVFYFIGYMILMEWKESGLKKKAQTVGRFAASSLCGGGLSAFLLLPMLYEMQSGLGRQNVGGEAIKNGAKFFYYRSILPMFLACSYDDSQRRDSMGTFPLLYCGIIAIFGIILFLMMKNIAWKEKFFQIFLLAIILISCNHMNLFFIWHGFYTPLGAPWRYAFLWSFVLLTAAHEGTAAFVEERGRIYNCLAMTGIGLLLFWIFWRFDSYRQITAFNIAVICGEVTGLFFWKYGKIGKRAAAAVLCMFVLAVELISNAVYVWSQGFEYESYTSYLEYIDEVEEILVEEEGVYRSEIAEDVCRNRNDGFLWRMNTIGSYTSTSKKNTYDIGRCLDIGELRDVRIYNTEAPLLSKDIIGLRYIYAREIEDTVYEKMETAKDGINIYENGNALPFGFLVNRTALDITSEDGEKDICEKQNILFHALAGSREMQEQDICKKISDGNQNGDNEGENYNYIEDTELVQKAVEKTAEYTLSVTLEDESDVAVKVKNEIGEAAYVCFSVPYERGWKAKVDGEEASVTEGMGGLLLVPVGEGEHEIQIAYVAPGSREGALISIICLAGMIVYAYYMRKNSEN